MSTHRRLAKSYHTKIPSKVLPLASQWLRLQTTPGLRPSSQNNPGSLLPCHVILRIHKDLPPRRTKRVRLGCIVFCTRSRRVLQHFEDQKNGKKMDARTQRQSGHQFLYPVLRWASAVQRIINTISDYNSQTNLCSVLLSGEVLNISSSFVLKLLRHMCTIYGGCSTFGFHSQEIGNHSIRSGAAMALFLMDHSPAKIMILGRWASDAFLVYIRPQVLEWTHNMSCDMIYLYSFSMPHTKTLSPPTTHKPKRDYPSMAVTQS
jgi:hypothetical protein